MMTATYSGTFALLNESCIVVENKYLMVTYQPEIYEGRSILIVGVAVSPVLVACAIAALAHVHTIENYALGLRAAL